MLRSRSQIRDALLLAMVSVSVAHSFGNLRGGGRRGAVRGLLEDLDSGGNQVNSALHDSSDKTKRILPAWGFRAEAANYSSTRKRSYRRACQRAVANGKALYKGKWYTAKQLGAISHVNGISQSRSTHQPLSGKIGQHTRAGRLKCLSWNSGSGNVGLWDELEAYGISECIDIMCIQETRMSVENEWSTASYHFLHTGKERSNTTQVCGVMIMISTKLARANQIRCCSVVKGHLLHVRVQIQDKCIDILGLYQHAWLPSESRQVAREHLLGSFQTALSNIPKRNLLLVCGDFNIDFSPDHPHIGKSPIRKASTSADDTHLLQQILRQHDLCAINTWAGRNEYTCKTDKGNSCIDAILLRRSHSDPQSRTTRSCRQNPLGIRSEGVSYHLPLIATISKWWRCWPYTSHASSRPTTAPSTTTTSQPSSSTSLPSSPRIDVDKMKTDSQTGSSKWLELVNLVSHLTFEPGKVNEQVLHLLHRFYPAQAPRPSQVPCSPSMYVEKWRVARALRLPAGSGIHSVFVRWKLVIRSRILHRKCHQLSRQRRREKLNAILDDARAAAQQHNVRALFQAIRRLSPKRPRAKIKMVSEAGLALSPSEEHAIIISYFRKLFVRHEVHEWEVPCCESCPITEEDLMLSFDSLKPHKAVPRHYAPTAVWRLLSKAIVPGMYDYLDRHWSDSRPAIPISWASSWVVLIPKPGKTRLRPEDLRPISLQDPIGKACLKAVVHRARDRSLSQLIIWPLYAYIPQRGTLDAITRVFAHITRVQNHLHTNRRNRFTMRSGQVLSDCSGGLQILIDLKSAFDLVSREAIGRALCELDLPQALVSILMSWYYITPYYILHSDEVSFLPGNTGVRQGCVAAPFLWTAFVLHWHKKIARMYGRSWVLDHLTTYADDHHVAWEFADLRELLVALSEAEFVLRSLEEEGMVLSLGKTQALLVLRGTRARGISKKIICTENGEKKIKLGSLTTTSPIMLPLVRQARYLGVQVSYVQSTAKCTLTHRQRQAKASYFILRPWFASGKLLLKDRLRLWDACIWPSMTFGLLDVGLSPTLGIQFRTQVLRQLRSVAHSVVYLSHESTRDFLARIQRDDPILVLAQQTVQHWSRRLDILGRCSSEDILHQGAKSLQQHFAEADEFAYWLFFCIHVAYSTSSFKLDTPSKRRLSQMTTTLSSHVMQTLYTTLLSLVLAKNEATPASAGTYQEDHLQHKCEQCERCFATPTSLRKHQTRMHGRTEHIDKRRDVELKKLGVDGMPVCPHCAGTFQDWRKFCAHMRAGVCIQGRRHLPHDSLVPLHGQELAVPLAGQLPLRGHGHAVRPDEPLPRAPLLVHRRQDLPQGMPSPDLSADQCVRVVEAVKPHCSSSMIDDHSLCERFARDWRSTLQSDATLRDRLLRHCTLCNMWCPHSAAVIRHLSGAHTSLYQQVPTQYTNMLEGEQLRTKYCRYCGFTSQANTPKAQNRPHRCGVVVQLAVLSVAHAARSGISRGSTGGSGDEDISRSPTISHQSRTGRIHRGRGCKEEASHPTIRRRICRKSRPENEATQAESAAEEEGGRDKLESIHRRIDAVGGSSVQAMHTTRGCAQRAEAGHRVCSSHVNRSRRSCPTPSSYIRKVEGTETQSANFHHKPTSAHLVPLALGGAPVAPQQVSRSSLHRPDVAAGSPERLDRSASCIRLPQMESRQEDVRSDGSEAIDHLGCAIQSEDVAGSQCSRSSSQVSCSSTTKCQHELEDCGFLARSRSEIYTGKSCSSASFGAGHELIPADARGSIASLDLATLEALPRDQREAGLHQCIDAVQATSTASTCFGHPNVGLSLTSLVSGPPTMEQAQFLSHTYMNPGVVCYMNSVMTALGWCWVLLQNRRQLGRLHRLLQHLLDEKVKILMLDPEYGNAVMHWPSPNIQHDIAEFWGYLMNTFSTDVMGTFSGWWAEVQYLHIGGDLIGLIQSKNSLHQALVLPLTLTSTAYSLQVLVDHWHQSENEHLHNVLLRPVPLFLYIQLECFAWDRSQNMQIKRRHSLRSSMLEEMVQIPVRLEDQLTENDVVTYTVYAALLHHGDIPQAGHYTALLRHAGSWVHRDDDRQSTVADSRLPSLVADVYCLILCRRSG